MEALEKLFRDELADLYDAEQQILKALPKMIEAASATELKNALQQHRKVTEGQVKRLEQIFRAEGKPAQKKCKGMAGLIAEGQEMLEEDFDDDVRDAAIIGAAQRVEHYEIAAYGTVRTFAEHLGKAEAVELLQETLDEEKEADETLTQIAESAINLRAAEESEESESGTESEGDESETEEEETMASTRGGRSSGRSSTSGRGGMSASGRGSSGRSGNSGGTRGKSSNKRSTRSRSSSSRSRAGR